MNFFYNIGIILFGFSIKIVALFKNKAKLWITGRKDIFNKIETKLQNENRPVIWIHCASLGEFEQGRPVIDSLRREMKTTALVLTFFSPSGYEIRKNYPQADYIFYLPLDTPKNAKRFLRLLKPSLVIFVKYEFWLNYLNEISRKQIPTILMSAKFRSNQLFFRWYGKFYRKAVFAFEHIFVQDKKSLELLRNVGYKTVSVAGDTRFDRVIEIAENTKQFPLIEKFTDNKFTMVAGSSWEKDEEIIATFFNRYSKKNIRLIIAPHEINVRHLEHIKKLFSEKILFFTQLTENSNLENSRILVIDTIGILSSIYQYGTISYIGGGFGKGIHNILEAATFGLPVIFGPNYHKFSEAEDLIVQQGAFSINNSESFNNKLINIMENRELLHRAGQTARKYVEANCGAKKMILYHIFNIQKNI